MIDLTNKPEGATHWSYFGDSKAIQYMKDVGNRSYLWWDRGEWCEGCSATYISNCKVIDSWSIYNNTKPLSELADEQRGLLFNHWCNGGGICSGFSECDIKTPRWTLTESYRAKQKSERELFIDAFINVNFSAPREQIIDKLFYKGFKWPKVGE